jgi:predicted Ser/Thr protein kinase
MKGINRKRRSEVLKLFPDADILGIGRRSVVLKEGDTVVKIEKDSHPGTAAREAKWLKILEGKKIGPELISLNRELGFVTYGYVGGVKLPEFIEQCEDPMELKNVLEQCLKKAKVLDDMGINKEEMHRPIKHAWVGESVRFIDFERCHQSDRAKNVTQLSQFLFIGNNPSAQKIRELFGINREDALELLKKYKNGKIETLLVLLDLDNVSKG